MVDSINTRNLSNGFGTGGDVVHKLTPEEQRSGSVFTSEMIGGMGPEQGGTKIIMKYKDKNGDGLITSDEMVSREVKDYDKNHKIKTSAIYKDLNGDGKIEKDELYSIKKYTTDRRTGDTIVLEYLDEDGDGLVDKAKRHVMNSDGEIVSSEDIDASSINMTTGEKRKTTMKSHLNTLF